MKYTTMKIKNKTSKTHYKQCNYDYDKNCNKTLLQSANTV